MMMTGSTTMNKFRKVKVRHGGTHLLKRNNTHGRQVSGTTTHSLGAVVVVVVTAAVAHSPKRA